MADSAMVSAIFVHKKIENFHPRFLSETFFTVPFFVFVSARTQHHCEQSEYIISAKLNIIALADTKRCCSLSKQCCALHK